MGRRLTIALALFAFLAVLLGTYVAGYLGLADTFEHYDLTVSSQPYKLDRIYSQRWLREGFRPAGKVEHWLRGIEVEVFWFDGDELAPLSPPIIPPTPAPIIHIADWPWVPEGEHGEGEYAKFLASVERIQLQQMDEIRKLRVRKVWVEGQTDESIVDYRARIEKLKTVELPAGDSPADQVIPETHRADLLQIGAAGRLLLLGELDDVFPLEDNDAWQTPQPVDGEPNFNANADRDQALANRLPAGAVIVLGFRHNLKPYLQDDRTVEVIRVEALP